MSIFKHLKDVANRIKDRHFSGPREGWEDSVNDNAHLFKIQAPLSGKGDLLIYGQGRQHLSFVSSEVLAGLSIGGVSLRKELMSAGKIYVEGYIDPNKNLSISRLLPKEEYPEW